MWVQNNVALNEQYEVELDNILTYKNYQRTIEIVFSPPKTVDTPKIYLNKYKQLYSEKSNLKVFFGTWNTGACDSFKSKIDFNDVLSKKNDYILTTNNMLGESGYYNYTDSGSRKSVKTYNSCSSCTVGFYYEYEVSDVVVIHNDVAELYYQFLGDEFTDPIEEVEIRIHLPGESKD